MGLGGAQTSRFEVLRALSSIPAKNGRKGPGPAIPFNAPGISKEAPARDVPAEQGGLAAKKSPQERALAMER